LFSITEWNSLYNVFPRYMNLKAAQVTGRLNIPMKSRIRN
jgi:hypothetical protein